MKWLFNGNIKDFLITLRAVIFLKNIQEKKQTTDIALKIHGLLGTAMQTLASFKDFFEFPHPPVLRKVNNLSPYLVSRH